MHSPFPLRIIVRLGWLYKAAREIARGIMRYASTHPYLQFEFCGVHEGAGKDDDYRRWRPDGIIGDTGGIAGLTRNCPTSEALRIVRRTCPACRAVVFLHKVPPPRGRGRIATGAVLCDHREVVCTAANLFRRRFGCSMREWRGNGPRAPQVGGTPAPVTSNLRRRGRFDKMDTASEKAFLPSGGENEVRANRVAADLCAALGKGPETRK